MKIDSKYFDEFILQLKPMSLHEKHCALYNVAYGHRFPFDECFERLVPVHIDYGSMSSFIQYMSKLFNKYIKTKQIEHLLSVYGWSDDMNDNCVCIFFRILAGESQDQIPKYYHTYITIMGEYITSMDQYTISLFYGVIRHLPKSQQEEITCLILDRNLCVPKIIFEGIHRGYSFEIDFIKTIENVLEYYGFDINENSSDVKFIKPKIAHNKFDFYSDRVKPEISSVAVIEIVLETLRQYRCDIAASCEKILLDNMNSGVDISTILLDELTKN
jgi:hypothetical protein